MCAVCGLAGLISGSAGGGLLGGMLLEDVIENHDERERQEGFDQGQSLPVAII